MIQSKFKKVDTLQTSLTYITNGIIKNRPVDVLHGAVAIFKQVLHTTPEGRLNLLKNEKYLDTILYAIREVCNINIPERDRAASLLMVEKSQVFLLSILEMHFLTSPKVDSLIASHEYFIQTISQAALNALTPVVLNEVAQIIDHACATPTVRKALGFEIAIQQTLLLLVSLTNFDEELDFMRRKAYHLNSAADNMSVSGSLNGNIYINMPLIEFIQHRSSAALAMRTLRLMAEDQGLAFTFGRNEKLVLAVSKLLEKSVGERQVPDKVEAVCRYAFEKPVEIASLEFINIVMQRVTQPENVRKELEDVCLLIRDGCLFKQTDDLLNEIEENALSA